MSKSSCTTRFSYAASDAAGQLVFCIVSFYLLKFYMDVKKVSRTRMGEQAFLCKSIPFILSKFFNCSL